MVNSTHSLQILGYLALILSKWKWSDYYKLMAKCEVSLQLECWTIRTEISSSERKLQDDGFFHTCPLSFPSFQIIGKQIKTIITDKSVKCHFCIPQCILVNSSPLSPDTGIPCSWFQITIITGSIDPSGGRSHGNLGPWNSHAMQDSCVCWRLAFLKLSDV